MAAKVLKMFWLAAAWCIVLVTTAGSCVRVARTKAAMLGSGSDSILCIKARNGWWRLWREGHAIPARSPCINEVNAGLASRLGGLGHSGWSQVHGNARPR